MNLNKTDVQAHTKGWHNIDWLDCQKKVEHLQCKIVVAFKSGEKNEKQFQHNLTKSFAARALAVRIVVNNTGRKTPG